MRDDRAECVPRFDLQHRVRTAESDSTLPTSHVQKVSAVLFHHLGGGGWSHEFGRILSSVETPGGSKPHLNLYLDCKPRETENSRAQRVQGKSYSKQRCAFIELEPMQCDAPIQAKTHAAHASATIGPHGSQSQRTPQTSPDIGMD